MASVSLRILWCAVINPFGATAIVLAAKVPRGCFPARQECAVNGGEGSGYCSQAKLRLYYFECRDACGECLMLVRQRLAEFQP